MAVVLSSPEFPDALALEGGILSLDGAVSLEPTDSRVELRPWRIPFEDLQLFSLGGPLNFLPMMARVSSGVRLSMVGSLRGLQIVAHSILDLSDGAVYDLVVNGRLIATQSAPAQGEGLTADQEETKAPKSYSITFDGFFTGPDDLVEVWLPHTSQVTIISVATRTGAVLRQLEDRRPRWIVHGSSITQCSEAASPARTWPATVARLANLNLLSLGYGGQCHVEHSVALIIRDQPADAITLKLGINMHNLQSLSTRLFASNVVGFIRTIREGHPSTPIVVVSPIFSDWREKEAVTITAEVWKGGALGKNFPTLEKMRKELKSLVELLRQRGDQNIYYLSGLELFSEAEARKGWLPDNLHPNTDGYEHMGRRFAEMEFGPSGRLLPGRVAPIARM